MKRWAGIYLKAAQDRLQKQLDGFTFTIEDVYIMQQMCAYEVGLVNHLHRQIPMTVIVDRGHRLLQILRSVY